MIDPSLINEDDLLRQAQELGESTRRNDAITNDYIDFQEESDRIDEEEENPKAKADRERQENIDSREDVKAIRSGLALSAESILTFPERAIDMTTGEYQRQIEEDGEYEVDQSFSALFPGSKTYKKTTKLKRGGAVSSRWALTTVLLVAF